MPPVRSMMALSLASSLIAIAVFGATFTAEIVAGMLGPLVAATRSWTLVEQTFRRAPERVTSVMIKAFAAKVVFFAAYVAIAIEALPLRPVPFVVSFTGYFVGLYSIEAFAMRRLFAEALGPARMDRASAAVQG